MTAIIVATLIAVSAPGITWTPVTPPADTSTGGPDAYGYRWIDSDTAGGPVYNWVDIKARGTMVTGLGDDNVVGPFPIGFDFPYYWYRVNQVYVGSNGYIAFHDNALAAHPFPTIPKTTRPNNLLAPLMSDIDCSVGGSVWYWGNSDTFIVQYDSVKFWNTGGNNTFQIILTRADSCIKFQYKEQTGTPYNGWTSETNNTGIENVGGNIGLSWLSGRTPSRNMYHPGLAILFYPPDSTNYQVHDAGIRNAMNDRSGGMFVLNGSPMTFWAVARNYGNQPEGDFKSFVRVKQGAVVRFTDSVTTSVPNPGDIDSIVFPNTYTPTVNGTYTIEVYTRLAGDVFPANDTAKVELHVVTLPGTLSYDDGVPEHMWAWNGPGGYGARFVPPVYPCSITTIRIMAGAQTATQCALGLFDDNGPGGSPGDTLFIGTINVTTQTWYPLNLPTPAVITEGAFFVGAMSAVPSAPSFGGDSTPPYAGQSWEYTGVWAPSRHADEDVMANAMITATGISEWLGPVPTTERLRIAVTPNPFGNKSWLRLSAPSPAQAVEVYDATGTLIQTFPISRGTAVLDGRRMAEGIYFARLAGAESPVAKLVVCR
ncbi:MAG: T9SS type A sorting domain-containing protein [candidate division WOR-3 bacterium]